MSEKEILIRMATVGSVLAAVCAVYAAAGLTGVLVGAACVDFALRQVEARRARAEIEH
ncbi:MAG: hypothetical protein AAFQ79_18015 [Pseudomonadota bacterium]